MPSRRYTDTQLGSVKFDVKGNKGDREVGMSNCKSMPVYHNYIKPHEGLNRKTPAEACGIVVNGEHKWMTLIQNAAAAK
jgi:hypothetical protein